jgi:hypothetical protein
MKIILAHISYEHAREKDLFQFIVTHKRELLKIDALLLICRFPTPATYRLIQKTERHLTTRAFLSFAF